MHQTNMGATPSHEDDGNEVADTEDSDDDDHIIKIQHRRYRVCSISIYLCNAISSENIIFGLIVLDGFYVRKEKSHPSISLEPTELPNCFVESRSKVNKITVVRTVVDEY